MSTPHDSHAARARAAAGILADQAGSSRPGLDTALSRLSGPQQAAWAHGLVDRLIGGHDSHGAAFGALDAVEASASGPDDRGDG